ncbi:MAG: PD40 domain-containing protein [Candidatus Fermentibacteraceae bacterium]|nr:PD40 domain-containing protein [Candidatus Fermentibacteraceae bacterium]
MFRRTAVTLVMLSVLQFTGTAEGNGYGDYPPDLAWSPVENVLAAALEDGLLLWEEHLGTILVAEGEVSSPAFSPDGEYVAFIMDREIYYFETDHPESPRKLVQAENAVSCTFDTQGFQGDHVLCYSTRYLGSQLYVTSLGSGEALLLLPEDSDARLNAPTVSPDGTNIACVNFTNTPGWYEELYIIGDAAPHGARARACNTLRNEFDWHESNPVWIDNDVLVYQIGGWGDWELRFLSIRTGGEKLLLDNAHQPCAALDGRYLAFCRRDPFPRVEWGPAWDDPTSVWVMDRETGYLSQASDPGEWAVEPAISNDGEYIAWIQVLPEGEELRVFESEAFISLR